MSTDEFEVDCGALNQGAALQEDVASRVGEIQSAALASTQMSPVAFGMLCSFFTPGAMALQGIALTTIAAVGGAVSAASGALQACATDYQTSDDTAEAGYRRLITRAESPVGFSLPGGGSGV